jgi:hypothetical protein
MKYATGLFAALLGLATVGCAPTQRTDYGAYIDHLPKSILVLPPLNQTAEVKAPEAFIATITMPLAERGYYVFPIAMADHYMKQNGLPTPGEMHQVSPRKLGQVFGADAVLYITIKEWTTTYVLLDSTTKVTLDYRLADAKTGVELWRREQTVAQSSSAGQSSLGGMLVSAMVHSATSAGHEVQTANFANRLLIYDSEHGMLVGYRNPDYEKELQRKREEQAQSKAS